MLKNVCFTPLKTRKVLENQGLQRNSLYNHADRRGYHQFRRNCISSKRSFVYHQAAGGYTLTRDEMQRRQAAFDDILTASDDMPSLRLG